MGSHDPREPSDPLDHAATVELAPAVDTDGETLTLAAGAAPPVAALPGEFRVIDPANYERGEEIARGGMGRIVAAHDVRHDRPVALKEPLTSDDELVARFRREALITARLQHPAIVPIYEAGLWPDGRPFFAMRRVDGRALDQVIRERPTLAERLPLLSTTIAVCEALAYAHVRGIVHRDLKPHNVLVGAYGETVVIDWGLARRVGAAERERGSGASGEPTVTLAGGAVGTPAYMAPEQARGGIVDERTDVYALGALLYHVLAGRAPYDDTAARAHALVELVADGPPTPLAVMVEGVPPELAAIVDKAMAREPAERYRTASELAGDLRRFGEGRLVGAHRYSLGTLLARWARRHRLALAVAGAVAVASVVAAAIYVRGLRVERARTAAQRAAAIEERGRAEAEARRAEAQTRTLLTEHGRQRLAAGRPLEAAAYLARAYQLGDDSPTVRALLGLAMPTVDAAVLRHGDGPTQTVADVALDPARGRIVTASWDLTLGVWDAATGARRATLTGPEKLAQVEVLPDGSAVTGDHAGRITRWDLDGGGPPIEWGRLPSIALWLEQSRDGRHLAATAFGGTTTVFEIATGRPRLTVAGPVRGSPARLSADGALLLVPGPRLARWDLATGRLLDELADHRPNIEVADDGRLGLRDEDSVAVWSAGGQRLAARARGVTISHHRWLADDLLLAYQDGTLERWDPSANAVRWTASLGETQVRGLSATATRVLVAGGDGVVRVFDRATGHAVGTLAGHDGEVYGAAATADGEAVVTFSGDGTARRWRLDQVVPETWPAGRGAVLRWSPDGRHLAIATTDGAALYDRRGALVRRLSTAPTVALDFTADGRAVVVGEAAAVMMVPIDGGPASHRHPTDGMVRSLGVLSDGRIAIAASAVTVWEPATGAATPVPTAPLVDVVALEVLPGDALALTNGRHAVAVTLDGKVRAQCGDHTAWISAVTPSGDDHIASGDTSGTIWLWSTTSPSLRRLPSAGAIITALAGEASGARVFAGTRHGELRIWDVATGRVLTTLAGPTVSIAGIAVAPDGGAVATLDETGQVRLWRVAPEGRSPDAVAAAVAIGAPFAVDDDGRLRARDGSPR